MTTSSSADVLFLPRPPAPAPGCVICADLDRKRMHARVEGDHSKVSDCNVRMRGHTHRTTPTPH